MAEAFAAAEFFVFCCIFARQKSWTNKRKVAADAKFSVRFTNLFCVAAAWYLPERHHITNIYRSTVIYQWTILGFRWNGSGPADNFSYFFFLVWFTIWMVRGKLISSANNSYMINTNWSGLYRMVYEVWQWVRRAKLTIYSIAQLKFSAGWIFAIVIDSNCHCIGYLPIVSHSPFCKCIAQHPS